MTNGIHTDTGICSHDWSNANGAMSSHDIRIENAANLDPREYVGHTTGSEDDTIIGGAAATANQTGSAGGAGNDRKFSGAKTSLADAIARGETHVSPGRGVYMRAGDECRDRIIGAAGNDVLFGGDGDDTPVGGGGSDIIFADDSDGGTWRTTAINGSEPSWVVGSNDPLSGESTRFALRRLLARRGVTTSDTTGRSEELRQPLASGINPLSDIDLSGLLATRRADIHPKEDDPINLIPDSQLTYAEITGGKCFGTNAGRGDDVIHVGAGDDWLDGSCQMAVITSSASESLSHFGAAGEIKRVTFAQGLAA